MLERANSSGHSLRIFYCTVIGGGDLTMHVETSGCEGVENHGSTKSLFVLPFAITLHGGPRTWTLKVYKPPLSCNISLNMKIPYSRLQKEILQLNDGTHCRLKERDVIDTSDLASQMLARYQEKTAPEDAFYDNFVRSYLDWKAFSEPLIKDLESGPSRRRSDQDMSSIWEKMLVKHRPRLEKLQHRFDEAKGSYRKRLDVSFIEDEDQKYSPDSEDLVSASTSPASEFVE
jgi:hypothetical protein